jgi:drug/metabolite transporter (DMT)-like permease
VGGAQAGLGLGDHRLRRDAEVLVQYFGRAGGAEAGQASPPLRRPVGAAAPSVVKRPTGRKTMPCLFDPARRCDNRFTPMTTSAAPLPSRAADARWLASPVLAWFFVIVWGSGYLATKAGLQYAPPFTFLALRFATGLVLLLPLALWWHRREPLRWPAAPRLWLHVVVAGLLMHAANLGGSHYAQYLGMSAGVAALVLSVQPLATAIIAAGFMGERLRGYQWLGVLAGLAGVALVVWHKVDVRALSAAALACVLFALAAITAGTLYQRAFCPTVDLRAASVVQFAATLAALLPLAIAVEGFAFLPSWTLLVAIGFLVVFASILAVNALHTLMRRGEATHVTSLLYLTPIIAVLLEWLLFGVAPTPLTLAGVAVACAGVALVAWRPQSGRAGAG